MNAMCPISFQKINENIARLNAALTAACLLLFLFSSWKWIILIVAADFFIRGFLEPKYSPFARSSKAILALLQSAPVMVDAAPKIFAARVGFVFSCLLIVSWLFNLHTAALILGLLFAAFALLEAGFRFCIACTMYPLICTMKQYR